MTIEKLEPQAFFGWFAAISKIPHGSKKEEKIKAFLVEFFESRNIPVETDGVGNVMAWLPATAGYEDQPAILFQAHMDMVCRKDEGVEFDFDNDPIELVIDGDKLRANGTTLGADNAVGVATMLAIADDPTIAHPKLELLFTACEEQGMVGIKNFDFNKIKARRMINMDCGDSHVIAICSAGKIQTEIHRQYALTPVGDDEIVLHLLMDGGLGGHSSLCADKNRCCCARAMGELLADIPEVRLCAFRGVSPIIKECTADIAVPAARKETVIAAVMTRFEKLKMGYAVSDPDIRLTITEGSAVAGIGAGETEKLSRLLSKLKTSRIELPDSDPDIVSLSILCEAVLENGKLFVEVLMRSTENKEMEQIADFYKAEAAALGFDLVTVDSYPVWKENPASRFRAKFQKIHTALYGKEMEIERVPGGIETVFVTKAIPDMDPVGIAPTARGAHTTNEHLFISEVEPYWEIMKAVLADKE